MDRLYKAILPDQRANEFGELRKAIRVVMDRIGDAGGAAGRVRCDGAGRAAPRRVRRRQRVPHPR